MMLYPAMQELLEQIPSRYQLVNVVAARARQIASQAEAGEEPLEDKPVSIAIREIAEGKVLLESDTMEVKEEPVPEEPTGEELSEEKTEELTEEQEPEMLTEEEASEELPGDEPEAEEDSALPPDEA